MPSRITLQITAGPIKGQAFRFAEHDTLLFGRAVDCQALFPEDDTSVSRHQFILEVNSPQARIRDLGSLNGTFFNDVKYSGLMGKAASGEARPNQGDEIQVGSTVFRTHIETFKRCLFIHSE